MSIDKSCELKLIQVNGENILKYMHHCKQFLTACFLCLRLLEVNIEISLSVRFKVNSFMFLIVQLQLHFYLGIGKLTLNLNIYILRVLLICAIVRQYSCLSNQMFCAVSLHFFKTSFFPFYLQAQLVSQIKGLLNSSLLALTVYNCAKVYLYEPPNKSAQLVRARCQ